MNRRTYLVTATAASLSLAGCTGSRDSKPRNGDDPESPSDGPSNDRPDGTEYPGAAGTADDFEALERWTVTGGRLTADPNRSVVGSQSGRIEVPEANQTATLAKTFPEPRDLSAVSPGIAAATNEMVVPWLHLIDDDGNRITHRHAVSGNLPLMRYDFGVDAVDSGFDATRVREVRLQVWTPDGESRTVWFDDLHFAPMPETGRVMIQFDDCHVTDYTEALPILEEYGYPAVTFVNSDYVDGGEVGGDTRLTTDHLRELRDAGWCVANHTETHPRLPDLSRAEQEAEIRDSKAWLEDRGFEDGAQYFAYPFGRFDATTIELVDEYHAIGFAGGLPAHGHVANTQLAPRIGDPDADRVRTALERTVELRGITSIFFHRLEGDDLAAFETMVETIHEYESRGDLEVILPADLEREFLY
ncbi:polysaccharide deacetylase family protein [Haloterrigena alkaliphila]|uniref:Polysaccharide deacetylase family protein n=1 Tax=Haloterrigena alkaliphila TaxID=2816475 RepID=A0A8A2VHN8_9EURY|nr:polysaccharide deacetylase family protein [Haloterrigena alkaliphila]QSX00178.1 polysaccharide deacetylase family protein [Haloterrigena alkaliphila]